MYLVDAFGATPNVASDDDSPGIQAAIDAAIHFANASGQTAVVRFSGGGEYRLKTGKPGRGYLDLSCVDGRGQVILRGQGAKLVVETPRLGLFFADGSRSVTIADVVIELATDPFLGCTVGSVDTEQRLVVAQPLPGATALADFPGYSKEWGWIHDKEVLHRPKAGARSSFSVTSRTQDSADGSIQFKIKPGVAMGDFAIGDVLSFHYRRGNNFRLQRCEDIRLEGVVSYGSGLFFVSASHVSGLAVRDCAVLVKPGRVQATNGDGIHLKYCRSVDISDCYLEGLSDDGVNVTGTLGFVIERCKFLDKRRHAIALDTDIAKYRSRDGLIADCTASGNGGSFLYHDGGDYSSVGVQGNLTGGNNLTSSGARVDRGMRIRAADGDQLLSWSRTGAVMVSGPVASLKDGWSTRWSIVHVPTARGPRCRVQAQTLEGPQPWLYLSGGAEVQVLRSVRAEPRLDPWQDLIDDQVWVQEFLRDGTFRLRHELKGLYLGWAIGEEPTVMLTPDAASLSAWQFVASDSRR